MAGRDVSKISGSRERKVRMVCVDETPPDVSGFLTRMEDKKAPTGAEPMGALKFPDADQKWIAWPSAASVASWITSLIVGCAWMVPWISSAVSS